MKEFTAKQYLSFLGELEKLKSVPRHSITSGNTVDYVAGHSWRVAMMALLLKNEAPEVDMDKVIKMCLIHDIGEAVTGDIPSFEKTGQDEEIEKKAVEGLLKKLPDSIYKEFSDLIEEMEALQTKEARFYKALDRMEAVIQHNESDISTWIPLEYELQKTYGNEVIKGQKILEEIREQMLADTIEKIEKN